MFWSGSEAQQQICCVHEGVVHVLYLKVYVVGVVLVPHLQYVVYVRAWYICYT